MALRSLHDVAAPAKLNRFLHVVGRREDGYHLLQSVFQLIDWSDALHFELRHDAALHRHDLSARLPAEDLCLRAAQALQRASGTSLGADIHIDKQVPWGAGMGGGSSDAASTLLALNLLWGLRWPLARLLKLGLTLGADVPFFLGGRAAWVEGIGEQLTPLNLPPQWFAVIKPAQAIATTDIFNSPLLVRNTEVVIIEGLLAGAETAPRLSSSSGPAGAGTELEGRGVGGASQDLSDWLGGFGRNDLQPPAQSACPEIERIAHVLQARFGNSRMTGSGSAVFARAGTGAQPAATMPVDLPPEWVGRMCRSLETHPLLGWAQD
jgi:4-diphosphocytidyl-2-C-methyl-D-erythritol kinase